MSRRSTWAFPVFWAALALACDSDGSNPANPEAAESSGGGAGTSGSGGQAASNTGGSGQTESSTGGSGGTGGTGGTGGDTTGSTSSGGDGTGGTAAGGEAGSGGEAGARPSTETTGSGGSAGANGTICNPFSLCVDEQPIGAGTLNRVFSDSEGHVYVGNGDGYYTNASGSWVSHALNAATWTIDASGVPYTTRIPDGETQVYLSMWTGSNWLDRPIPLTEPIYVPYSHADHAGDVTVAPDGTPYVAWVEGDFGGAYRHLTVSHWTETDGWTSTRMLSDYVYVPAIDVDDDGFFWVVYANADTQTLNWVTDSPNGTPHREGDNILEVPYNLYYSDQEIAARGGRVYIISFAFYRADIGLGAGDSITVFELDAAGAILGEFEHLSCPTYEFYFSATQAKVAVDSQGNAHAVWIGRDDEGNSTGSYYASNRGGQWQTFAVSEEADAIDITVTPTDGVYLAQGFNNSLSLLTVCE